MVVVVAVCALACWCWALAAIVHAVCVSGSGMSCVRRLPLLQSLVVPSHPALCVPVVVTVPFSDLSPVNDECTVVPHHALGSEH